MTTLRIVKKGETKDTYTYKELFSGISATVDIQSLKEANSKLHYWRKGASSFSAKLFDLLCKADDKNKLKIFIGFPEETIVFLLWYQKGLDEDE